ncbi:MAG: chemotaxis protein CheA [Burkholderiaceae bacterium]|nr:chemotaxis protein CheA [Burkholderiaceae bacterium]
MTIDVSQFFQVFFDEAEELLAEMERLLLAIDVENPDSEDLNAIFRTAHSIKGGASTFGLTELIDVTHLLETLLDRIRKGEMALTSEHVDAFLLAKDTLKMQVDGLKLQTPVDQEAVADVRMMLQSLSQNAQPIAPPPEVVSAKQAAAEEKFLHVKRSFRVEMPELAQRDIDALATEMGLLGRLTSTKLDNQRHVFTLATDETADDIMAICSFILDPEDVKITEEAPLPAAADLTAEWIKQTEEEQGYGFFQPIEELRAFIAEDEPEAARPVQVQEVAKPEAENTAEKRHSGRRESDRQTASQETSSIRVGIEKVDLLINLVGELVITQAMIEQRTGMLDPMQNERLLNSVSQLTRNTRALQESVMSIRMIPMDYVFSRFPRMVRDLASKLGKKVEFVTQGAATELDKGLIERIVDPLTHLVRNSIDHGIETPEIREAAGKGERGRLSLSAAHQGGNIIIEVSDDGGGLNRERILDKARQQGIAVSDNMADEDVWQLIFTPGFSTAEVVTDVSGRGVGMDVVKRNITAMGGVVDIRSAKGFGTTISISLPLTLAILDGMSIRVGEETYILPLGYVVESLQPERDDIKEISGHGKVVKVRGEYLPLIPLYQMFDIVPSFTDPSQGLLVILESDGKKAALFVDDLLGQQQVVVKNLESNYRKVAGISGATILGDGGVSLIVDVAALIRSSRQLADETILSI